MKERAQSIHNMSNNNICIQVIIILGITILQQTEPEFLWLVLQSLKPISKFGENIIVFCHRQVIAKHMTCKQMLTYQDLK